ncbi:retinin [Ceratitis capitata]|uniref:(Mediterranean fruit fly) hypothetical protein n=2 Tax=Ceratitis capitata TaxID=7213 RepID=A0A811VDN4_CERCA|nr:retinin [Ceratitis capitata]CAD7013985.1 unnamed protein product [Ceratitis capitata]
MFKLVALLMLVNAVVGKAVENPEIIEAADTAEIHLAPALHATSIIHEPTLAKVGDLVHSVPTAVSHQSSTIVHNRANIVTPIVTPALKTHITPLVSSYVSPLVRSYPSAYPYGYYYGFHPYGYKSVY